MFGFRIFVFFILILSISATLQETIDSIIPGNNILTPEKLSHSHRERRQSKMARHFVDAHNHVRTGLGLPPLHWNRTVARYARHWASQRADDCALMHSPNSPYGENLFWSLKGHWSPHNVVKCWADESVDYDPKTNECINGHICGHYTQIIWKTTSHIGCGRIECNANKGFLYVCSYDPPGNYYFQGPFGGTFTKSIVYPPPGL